MLPSGRRTARPSAHSGSGVNVRVRSRRSQERWARRKRVDSPSPIFIEIRSSLALSTMPGMPIQIGSAVPRPRTAPTHAAIVVGVEADLADDVGGQRRLLEHRLDRRLVVDQVVALRIAGDAQLGEGTGRARAAATRRRGTGPAPSRRRPARRPRARRPPSGARRSPRGARRRAPAAPTGAARPVALAPARCSATASVASSPRAGEAVTVTFTVRGTCATPAPRSRRPGRTS